MEACVTLLNLANERRAEVVIGFWIRASLYEHITLAPTTEHVVLTHGLGSKLPLPIKGVLLFQKKVNLSLSPKTHIYYTNLIIGVPIPDSQRSGFSTNVFATCTGPLLLSQRINQSFQAPRGLTTEESASHIV